MAKKSTRKRSALKEKNQAGCMWGLISVFDFRQGRFTHKLISDRRRESSGLVVGAECSRGRLNLLAELQENHEVLDTGCTERHDNKKTDRSKNDIVKRSVKVLMEEEMSGVQKPDQFSRTEDEQISSNPGHGQYTEKNVKQVNKANKVANSNASECLETALSQHSEIREIFSWNLNLATVVEEFFRENHPFQEMHCCKNRTDHCLVEENVDPDAHIVQEWTVLEKMLSEVVKIIDTKRLSGDGRKEFLNALDIINSNKELFLKHLHDQTSKQMECSHNVHSAPVEEVSGIESPKIPERHKVVGDISSKQCELHKHGVPKFFRKKEKAWSNKSKETDLALDRIVLLKPSSANIQNPKAATNLSTSPLNQHSLRSAGEKERTTSHFSFREMKRMLKQAIGDGRKDNQWMREKTSHQTTDNSQQKSDTIKEGKRPTEFHLNVGSEVSSSRATRIHAEAKKHLAELLSVGDKEMDLQGRQVPRALGRILSLPDYNLLSPRFSPGRDIRYSPGEDIKSSQRGEKQPIHITQPMKSSPVQKDNQEVTASPLTQLEENLEGSSSTIDESDVELQVPNLIRGLSEGDHDMNLYENLCIKKDKIPEDGAGTSEISSTECTKDDDILHANSEVNIDRPSVDSISFNGIIDRHEADDEEPCEESPKLTSRHIPISPSSLLIQMVDCPESINEKTERPSPVSVLDPFFTEEIGSPESFTMEHADPVPPRTIHFEETDNTAIVIRTLDFGTNTTSCISDEESRFEYVKNVLETSGLGCGDLSERQWHPAEQLLDPSLFDEVETSSGEFSDDLKLLFDCINEALMEIYERYVGPSPWVSFIKPKAQSCPKGGDLVQEVFEGIDWYNLFCCPHTLEQIVGEDLAKAGTWMDLRLHVECVGIDMEEAILEDLIEETILKFSL
ncbi:hypothetical protein QJS04_geneDACA000394 [Acorus gramineus]|uniref:DUF4378 domain-containing protein n=1 Tax=Acorus gramineus TaxID=55184 RepID=A0AAV9ATM5_ACOGR|nr:hypothetical protein QJS04_geneDACA000394 [Acorus gramineus]